MAAPIVNAMSVDVEDYFQVENFAHRVPRDQWHRYAPRVERNTHRLLDLFEAHGVRATFFVLGWVAERFGGLVKAIRARGHEVACHSYYHRLIYNLTADEMREDTRRSKAVIEDLIGEPVRGYRAPSYSITARNLWALDVLAEEGFEYDSSIFPVHHDRYGIPDFSRWPVHGYRTPGGHRIDEFPLTTFQVGRLNLPAAGGGYLRILPSRWTHHGIRAANRQGRPAILYIHPWEIDEGQPRMPGLGALRHLRCYYNLAGTYARLEEVLASYRWGPVREVLATSARGVEVVDVVADLAVGVEAGRHGADGLLHHRDPAPG
jgi:polysaccharide deacetylase family protein (PEP-CTERM system associated)